MNAHDKLLGVFKYVFPQVPVEELESYRDWDSLSGVELIAEIEKTFQTTVDLNRVMELDSFASILAYLTGTTVTPKKGLITDLDGTLWHGIIGERTHRCVGDHMQYQKFLDTQADRGLLVAVASKNTLSNVQYGLSPESGANRYLKTINLYPIVANWGPKSQMVDTILKTWNIRAADVVFVDDSPMELAEVKSVFPDITTVLYDGRDETLTTLRELCERKGDVSYEDHIRMQSIRSGMEFKRAAMEVAHDPDEYLKFLKTLHGHVKFKKGWTERAQELVDKTNQFNLNGIRRSREYLEASDMFTVSYTDKFGPLGTIAVVHGHVVGDTFYVDTFAMSCRALSREIERHILVYIFEEYDVQRISFGFKATKDNRAFETFLLAKNIYATLSMTRKEFAELTSLNLPHAHNR